MIVSGVWREVMISNCLRVCKPDRGLDDYLSERGGDLALPFPAGEDAANRVALTGSAY